MASTGRDIPLEALNERRRQAVRLRLAGLSSAESARQTELSQPTVNAAFKAYRHGGWSAVPVAPRGRGIRKKKTPSGSASSPIRAPGPRSGPASPYARLATPGHLRRLEAE